MKEVKITLIGNNLIIDPWVPSMKTPLTGVRKKRRAWPVRGRDPYILEPIQLYYEIKKGTAFTHAGLLSTLVSWLKSKKIPYVIDDKSQDLPIPDFSQVDPLREYQPQVLATICSSKFGIIDCATGLGKTFMIEQLCKIYPNLKILVVSGSVSVVNSIFERICRACPGKKVSKHSGSFSFKEESDVVVSTVGVLYKIPPEWPDLLLYDEAHEAGSPSAMSGVLNFPYCRRFGLSASPKGRSDLADKLVEALFGPVIVNVTYQEAQDAGLVSKIECLFMQVSAEIGMIDYSDLGSDIQKKKEGYWKNEKRNRLIAEAAKNFKDKQVLIFVEKTEHALRLKQLLPEYTVVHGGVSESQWDSFVRMGIVDSSSSELKSPKSNEIRQGFEKGEIQKAICTTTWNKGVDFPNLSVLIRGDGQTSSIPCTQIVGRLARVAEGKTKGTLIDFSDNFHPWFRSRSNKRREQYRSKGWTIHENWSPNTSIGSMGVPELPLG